MTGAKFKVVPVRRRDGKTGPWIMTDTHRAQEWAIGLFRRGHSVALIIRGPNRALMEGKVASIQRMFEGPIKGYQLGKRMGVKS